MVQECFARSSLEHRLRRLSAQDRPAHQPSAQKARDGSEEPALRADCARRWVQVERDSLICMLWWIGSGLIFLWVVLRLFAPRGWLPLLLISGISILIIQIAAYRKTKSHR